jgi:hypothetical protein
MTHNNNYGRVDNSTPSSQQVTSLSDLKNYSKGTVVELPSFAEGQPFIARLKRPSLLVLIKSGKIPNSLLVSANSIFQGGLSDFDAQSEDSLKNMYDILDIICEAALVEPSYLDIKEAGIQLSDDQIMSIFAYTQQGVKALEQFRQK